MKKTNIILSIFNVILSIALIIMVLLYINAIKMEKENQDKFLEMNETYHKSTKKIEEKVKRYENITNISMTTNTTRSNSTEPYIPDGMTVAAPNDNSGIKASDLVMNTKPENVTIEIIEDSITDTSVEILITDNNEDPYGWGVQFAIQEKINDEWKYIEYTSDRVAWIALAYNLDENNQLKQKLDIEKYYGKLEKGIYRVIKTNWCNNEYVNLYSNEFEIK